MPHKLSKLEQQILAQLGPIKYATPGRPSNKKKGLLAMIVAAEAYNQKKQIKDDSNDTN